MSERKSAEIKFRCTPSFKSNMQAAADAAGQSLTEFIESAVWALHNQKLDGNALIDNAIETLAEADTVDPTVRAAQWYGLDPESEQALALEGATPPEPVQNPPAGAPLPEQCACRPWEFCTHKASA